MIYSIIGTGAIGGYYGGMLAHSGHEVHFLVHSDYKEMQQELRVDSCNGNFTIPHPHAYKSTTDMPATDVVIVALKTINNDLLPTLLAPLMDSKPTVLLIQNGLCVEQDLAEKIPGIKLVAGLAFICSKKPGPAHIYHEDYGKLTLANYSADDSMVKAIADDFAASGVPTDIVEYNFGRWRKAIWNLPFNGLCVVTGMDTQQLLADPHYRQLVGDIMHEVVAIANALGVDALGEAHIQKNIQDTEVMKPYWPSMKVDFDHHRPLEVYYLYTRALMEADRLGVAVPNLRRLEAQLRAL